ncbi:substrate-binding domain-containing protein [Nonomuraea sp. B12E4]|uniref:substrate-binding domain-containing protein n=1 Tax=Nonomuraea sp. B12E4 TaxID=3153564 RepID=UPI00325E947D
MAARAGRARAIYVRCPYVLTDYFGLIVSSVGETIEPHGRQMILGAGEAAQRSAVLPALPGRQGVAGAVLILRPEPGEELLRLRDRRFPFVVIDPRTPPPKDIVAVSAAYFAGELLDLPEPPTALVAFNDKMAVGALWAAAERGLRVPGDLSVAGFDDIDVATATSPPLTTVRQPLAEMGRMAVTLLMRLLGRHTLEALHVSLGTEVIVRGSTGPVPR